MELFKKWAQREYSAARRLGAIALAGVLFVILIPIGLALGSGALDGAFHLPRLHWGIASLAAGSALIAVGIPLALWSIYVQFRLASGTPLPFMPTQKLVVTGPFVYCRNPMTLGALVAYLGIAVLLGSISGLLIVAVFTVLLLLYIKLIEEKELADRFGEAYEAYRRSTPLILPSLPRKSD